MAKKRKLNSKNPKYWDKVKTTEPKIKEKRLIAKVNPTNVATGEKVMTTVIPVYGVFYEQG